MPRFQRARCYVRHDPANTGGHITIHAHNYTQSLATRVMARIHPRVCAQSLIQISDRASRSLSRFYRARPRGQSVSSLGVHLRAKHIALILRTKYFLLKCHFRLDVSAIANRLLTKQSWRAIVTQVARATNCTGLPLLELARINFARTRRAGRKAQFKRWLSTTAAVIYSGIETIKLIFPSVRNNADYCASAHDGTSHTTHQLFARGIG